MANDQRPAANGPAPPQQGPENQLKKAGGRGVEIPPAVISVGKRPCNGSDVVYRDSPCRSAAISHFSFLRRPSCIGRLLFLVCWL